MAECLILSWQETLLKLPCFDPLMLPDINDFANLTFSGKLHTMAKDRCGLAKSYLSVSFLLNCLFSLSAS